MTEHCSLSKKSHSPCCTLDPRVDLGHQKLLCPLNSVWETWRHEQPPTRSSLLRCSQTPTAEAL